MSWDHSECVIEYTEALEYLRNCLGIVQVDNDICREELLPYQVVILKYINRNLITLGSDVMKHKIEKILEIFAHGADKIVTECAPMELATEVGIDTENENYVCCRFVFAWTNFLTALCIRLKFQYAYLFTPEYDGECCKCGARGETSKDQESWVSNVFPHDEMYDRTNYTRSNAAWQVSKDRYCDCYRHNSDDDSGE